jgi:hypothetical protein
MTISQYERFWSLNIPEEAYVGPSGVQDVLYGASYIYNTGYTNTEVGTYVVVH